MRGTALGTDLPPARTLWCRLAGGDQARYLRMLTEALKRQAQYVTRLPLWLRRGVWWYFGRRHLLADRLIDLRREAS